MLTNTILQTNRLTFSQFTSSDAPFILQLVNCPTWIEFIGEFDIKTPEDARNFIENSIRPKYEQNGFGLWKVTLNSSNTPIGLCGLGDKPQLAYHDLGVALLPEYDGKGYGIEAVKATLNYAWTTLNLDNVCSAIRPQNTLSERISRKLGFEFHHIQTLPVYGEMNIFNMPNPKRKQMDCA